MIYNAIVAANLSPPLKLSDKAHCRVAYDRVVHLYVSHGKPQMLN